MGKRIGSRWVLTDIGFELEAGAALAVLGPNGAGKTTLLKVLAGIWGRNRGQLWRFGQPTPMEGETDRRLGFLSHRALMYPGLTARENLWLQVKLWGLTDGRRRVEQALAEVGLGFAADEVVRTFSRGMVQRLAIARLFLTEPRLILLDEPYTGLDALARDMLDARLAEFKRAGGAAVLVTHYPQEAVRLAEAVAYLRRGRMEWWASTEGWTAERLESHYRGWLQGREGGPAHP